MIAGFESKPRYQHLMFEGRQSPGGYAAALKVAAGAGLKERLPRRPSCGTEAAPVGQEAEFVGWLLARAELQISRYRWRPLARRISACLRALRVNSMPQAVLKLQRQPQLLPVALNALLIGVTGFFRDGEAFDYLRQWVLPELAQRRLKVWSVASSDGSELYSLAILLAELGYDWGRLLGSDCRSQAVQCAAEGWFAEEAVRSVPADLRQRYFQRERNGLRVVSAIRSRIEWETADVFAQESRERWDVISCRNLAIYLTSDAADALWKKLAASLAVGGVLLTGKAERLPPAAGLVRVGPCVYRARGS